MLISYKHFIISCMFDYIFNIFHVFFYENIFHVLLKSGKRGTNLIISEAKRTSINLKTRNEQVPNLYIWLLKVGTNIYGLSL